MNFEWLPMAMLLTWMGIGLIYAFRSIKRDMAKEKRAAHGRPTEKQHRKLYIHTIAGKGGKIK